MQEGARRRLFAGGRTAAVAIGFVCLFLPVPHALDSRMFGAIADLGHIPLFFLVHRVLRDWWPQQPNWTTAAVAVAVGGASELLQALTWRDPALDDFLRDGLGVAVSLVGLLAWDRSPRIRLGYRLGLLLLLLWGTVTVAREALTMQRLARLMPTLASFENDWELARWRAKGGTVILVSERFHADGEKSLAVRCSAVRYPGVALEGFDADWRSFRWLEWTTFVPDGRPLTLTVRVDQRTGNQGCTWVLPIHSEVQVCRLDLLSLRSGPCSLDLGDIGELHLFLDEPREARTLYIDRVRLVADR
jgi:hypothetical protein